MSLINRHFTLLWSSSTSKSGNVILQRKCGKIIIFTWNYCPVVVVWEILWPTLYYTINRIIDVPFMDIQFGLFFFFLSFNLLILTNNDNILMMCKQKLKEKFSRSWKTVFVSLFEWKKKKNHARGWMDASWTLILNNIYCW